MATPEQDEMCRRLEACLMEGGWEKGKQFTGVVPYSDVEGMRFGILHPRDYRDSPTHARVMWKAFTLCGLTTSTFEEWSQADELDAATQD